MTAKKTNAPAARTQRPSMADVLGAKQHDAFPQPSHADGINRLLSVLGEEPPSEKPQAQTNSAAAEPLPEESSPRPGEQADVSPALRHVLEDAVSRQTAADRALADEAEREAALGAKADAVRADLSQAAAAHAEAFRKTKRQAKTKAGCSGKTADEQKRRAADDAAPPKAPHAQTKRVNAGKTPAKKKPGGAAGQKTAAGALPSEAASADCAASDGGTPQSVGAAERAPAPPAAAPKKKASKPASPASAGKKPKTRGTVKPKAPASLPDIGAVFGDETGTVPAEPMTREAAAPAGSDAAEPNPGNDADTASSAQQSPNADAGTPKRPTGRYSAAVGLAMADQLGAALREADAADAADDASTGTDDVLPEHAPDAPPESPVFEKLEGRRRRVWSKGAASPVFADLQAQDRPSDGITEAAKWNRELALAGRATLAASVPPGPNRAELLQAMKPALEAAEAELYEADPEGIRRVESPEAQASLQRAAQAAPADEADAAQASALRSIHETCEKLMPPSVTHWYFGREPAERVRLLSEAAAGLSDQGFEVVRRTIESLAAGSSPREVELSDLPEFSRFAAQAAVPAPKTADGLRDGSPREDACASRAEVWLTRLGRGISRALQSAKRSPGCPEMASSGEADGSGTSGMPSPATFNVDPARDGAAPAVRTDPDPDVSFRRYRAVSALLAMVSTGALALTLWNILKPAPLDVVVDRPAVESAAAMMRIMHARPGMPERPELAGLNAKAIDQALAELAAERRWRIHPKDAAAARPEGPMPDVTAALMSHLGITPVEQKTLREAVEKHWLLQGAERGRAAPAVDPLHPGALRSSDPLEREAARVRLDAASTWERLTRRPEGWQSAEDIVRTTPHEPPLAIRSTQGDAPDDAAAVKPFSLERILERIEALANHAAGNLLEDARNTELPRNQEPLP